MNPQKNPKDRSRARGPIRWRHWLFVAVSTGCGIYFAVLIGQGQLATMPGGELSLMVFLAALVLAAVVQGFWLVRLESRCQILQAEAAYDALTHVFNRRYFEEILANEMRRSSRYHFPLTLCCLDLDDFKSYNEQFGPTAGDQFLSRFSRFLRSHIRVTDVIGRFASDEFHVLLPHTELIGGEKFISRVLIQAQEMADASFSSGLTTYRAGEDREKFLGRAQAALHQAKKEGKRSIRCLIHSDDSTAVLSF